MQNKAWFVRCDGEIRGMGEPCRYGIGYCFAPTRGQAKRAGLDNDPGDCEYLDIRVCRVPSLDGCEADFGGVAGAPLWIDIYNPRPHVEVLRKHRLAINTIVFDILNPDHPFGLAWDADHYLMKPHEYDYVQIAVATFHARAEAARVRLWQKYFNAFREYRQKYVKGHGLVGNNPTMEIST